MGIPSIGVKTSKAVEAFFDGKPRRAVNARADEWAEIDGIGRKTAEAIDRFLKGE
jgi:NAD-dependent DNA ligase